MIFSLLADAPAVADPMIPGSYVITLLTALVGALGAIYAKHHGARQALKQVQVDGKVTVNGIPQPIEVRYVEPPLTKADLAPLFQRVDRLEDDADECRRERAKQFVDLTNSGNERELRTREAISASSRAVHERLDDLVPALAAQFATISRRRRKPSGT